ncbi:hypothetical protein KP509_26G007700 [Ceratopteris richardii]|uniref:Uncharacterized protein n=1 Tax=Ceratopteris richardii TaxID=49495 RepID=A0A8T2RK37_CERRI|nr:hypothetical protein KP509_26G007700 [Ceratopteris richardii]
MKEWRAEAVKEKGALLNSWNEEREEMRGEIDRLKGKVSTLEHQLMEVAASRVLEEGEIQPSMIEEPKDVKEEVRTIKEDEEKKSWAAVISESQKKVQEAEKWIEVAKKGKSKDAPCTPTLINMTLEEEQRRQTRALHVRVTGLKDINDVEKEVKTLTSMMGMEKPLHTKAWRVGKKSKGLGESSKERALILRFPSLEEKKEFLRKRPILKKTGVFLGDDLTLSQLAHMREVMPEIREAREKGKLAFYRDGRVVILERRTT